MDRIENDQKNIGGTKLELSDEEREAGIVRLLAEAYYTYCKKNMEQMPSDIKELTSSPYDFMGGELQP